MKIFYTPKLKQLSRTLRKNSTLSEVLLWNKLKGRQICGCQFMRQKPIGNYIMDFYCSKLKLAIEIDGISHDSKFKEDKERQKDLEKLGISVIRFNDLNLKKDIDSVLRTIEYWINKNGRKIQPPNPLY